MQAITYSAARKHLVETMETVCDNHEAMIITRKSARSVVLISLDDYNAIQETAYLLRNPANAANLRQSIQQFAEGKCKTRDLLDDEDHLD